MKKFVHFFFLAKARSELALMLALRASVKSIHCVSVPCVRSSGLSEQKRGSLAVQVAPKVTSNQMKVIITSSFLNNFGLQNGDASF